MLAPPVVEGEADEAVFKEWDDRVVMATTTAASLDAEQDSGVTTLKKVPRSHGGVIDQTRSERASKHSYDSPLLGVNTPRNDEETGVHTPGSDEGRPNINELMAICKNLSVIRKLKKKVKRLEKKLRARTPRLDLFKIEGDFDDIDDMVDDAIKNVEGDAKTQGRNSDKTEELNLSDKGSGGTEVFDDTTAAQKDVNAA
ncbi:hypothetical protein Tco_0035362, partial [Tanacetum coccineum]